ncbi:MAG: hypothetical protein HN348_07930 [Proteobacteria bacterium]|jgi:hypothetical protein|nr:hypothetical protein [Pseudomonadota bacterium]
MMGKLFDQLVGFYEKAEWPMGQVPNEAIISTQYSGDNGQWVFVVSCDEELGTIVMFSRGPLECPPDKLGLLIEFFARVNFGMSVGAWVVDFSDGEIRFRVGLDAKVIDVSDAQLQRMTMYTVMTMDHYLPGLMALLNGEADVGQAYDLVFNR